MRALSAASRRLPLRKELSGWGPALSAGRISGAHALPSGVSVPLRPPAPLLQEPAWDPLCASHVLTLALANLPPLSWDPDSQLSSTHPAPDGSRPNSSCQRSYPLRRGSSSLLPISSPRCHLKPGTPPGLVPNPALAMSGSQDGKSSQLLLPPVSQSTHLFPSLLPSFPSFDFTFCARITVGCPSCYPGLNSPRPPPTPLIPPATRAVCLFVCLSVFAF